MTDDTHNTSINSDHTDDGATTASREDAETTVARRELKHTSISEKGSGIVHGESGDASPDENSDSDSKAQRTESNEEEEGPAGSLIGKRSPALSSDPKVSQQEELKSPKKKRAHDELDESKDVEDGFTLSSETVQAPNGSAAMNRTDRSEPEKKRARDGQEHEEEENGSSRSSLERTSAAAEADSIEMTGTEEASASSRPSPFVSSTFGKLSGSAVSPFAGLGGQSSIFKRPSGAPSQFAAACASVPSQSGGLTLSLSGTPTLSPFGTAANGTIPGSTFGSGLGGFSLTGGARLSSFASGNASNVAKKDKPAKPFGAPESDGGESDEGENEGENGNGEEAASDKEDDREREREESKGPSPNDKKIIKLHKITVDDGESKEVTLLAVRTKMFQLVMENSEKMWKERGAGLLKVNVPRPTVEFDENGVPDPASFDASELDDAEDGGSAGRQNVRLLMRQENTGRVVLNTVILPAMEFKIVTKLKTTNVLFTAIEGGEAKQVQMKMNGANANALIKLTGLIQRSLADV